MKHRTHGPGSVWEMSPSPGMVLLYDFDVNSDHLKSAHTKYLEDRIVSAIKGADKKKWKLVVEGRTSRSGTAEHNFALSERRARNTYKYILDRVGAGVFVEASWVGEQRAALDGQKDGTENKHYRSVLIRLTGEDQPLPPPPPKIQPPVQAVPRHPAPNKPFQIRIANSLSLAYTIPMPGPGAIIQPGVSADVMVFHIRDVEEKVTYVYSFTAMGRTLGPSHTFKNMGASTTAKGEWNDFTGPRWLTADDFSGPAQMESASLSYAVNSKGTTSFSFRPLHWYSPSFGFRISDFKTGRTVGTPGVGIAVTTGTLKLLGRLSE